MNFLERVSEHIKRLSFESALLIILGLVFFDGVYEKFSNPMQLVLLKMLLVSVGVYHAHLIGKFMLPEKVDWSQKIAEQKGVFYARISLYIIIPLSYAMGG